MSKEEYKKLNDYLNDCFRYLKKDDRFLLDNIYNIGYLSELYIKKLNEYEIKNDLTEDYLSYEEVYQIARQIIENINPKYLEKYDNLIKNGQLDFSYNNEYCDSHFVWDLKTGIQGININRSFDYNEVCILVHEFMHMMNFSKNISGSNRYLFTEFISIYFEEYARNYLLSKGIEKEKLNFNERLICTKFAAIRYEEYSVILLAYENFGSINANTFNELNNYFYMDISKEEFESVCNKVLHCFQRIENTYKTEAMYEKPFDLDELSQQICRKLCISSDYRYIMGTFLAYYQLKKGNKEQMIYLSEHINDSNLNPIEILETIGINLETISPEDFIGIIEENILKNNIRKVK